jgi:hypothetical protein
MGEVGGGRNKNASNLEAYPNRQTTCKESYVRE